MTYEPRYLRELVIKLDFMEERLTDRLDEIIDRLMMQENPLSFETHGEDSCREATTIEAKLLESLKVCKEELEYWKDVARQGDSLCKALDAGAKIRQAEEDRYGPPQI